MESVPTYSSGDLEGIFLAGANHENSEGQPSFIEFISLASSGTTALECLSIYWNDEVSQASRDSPVAYSKTQTQFRVENVLSLHGRMWKELVLEI